MFNKIKTYYLKLLVSEEGKVIGIESTNSGQGDCKFVDMKELTLFLMKNLNANDVGKIIDQMNANVVVDKL